MPTLTSFIKVLESEGYVETYDELNPYLEPTDRLISSDLRGTTIRFKVRGSDIPCIGNVVNTRSKLYKAIGASNDVEAYSKILSILSGGKEAFIEKNFNNFFAKVPTDLRRIPFIKFFRNDGGMYVTSSVVIAKTPDTHSYNASVHRLMFIDERRVAIRIVPRHLYRIVRLNSEASRETPIAIVIGVHPSILLAASASPPYGVFELGLLREIIGSELMMCRTPNYDLLVPCEASIVMEGRITSEVVNEGPFLDLLDLYDRVRTQPVIHVESIYVTLLESERLFHVILPGGMEHKLLMGFPKEAAIWDSVRRVVPKVHKVRLTPAGGCWLHAVISIDKNSDGDAKNAIMAAFTGHPSLKHVVVVDRDVDPDNPYEVEWAIATRVQAGEDLVVIRGARGSTLDPSSEDGLTDKLGIDATAPMDRYSEFSRPEELRWHRVPK